MLIFHWFLMVFGIPCIFALSNKAPKSIKKLLFLKLFAIRSHLVPSGWPGSVLAPRPYCHAPPAQPVEPAPQERAVPGSIPGRGRCDLRKIIDFPLVFGSFFKNR